MNEAVSFWGAFDVAPAAPSSSPTRLAFWRSTRDETKEIRVVAKPVIRIFEAEPADEQKRALRLALPIIQSVAALANAPFDPTLIAPISLLVQNQATRWAVAFADVALSEAGDPDAVVMPSVHPTVRGGIQLEWHRKGLDLEIEVLPSGQARAYIESPNGTPVDSDLSHVWPQVEAALRQVMVR